MRGVYQGADSEKEGTPTKPKKAHVDAVPSVRTSIAFPVPVHRALVKAANESGRSITAIVIGMVRAGLKKGTEESRVAG